jgi:threonine/homoserine/homoserine lactone efflux protein
MWATFAQAVVLGFSIAAPVGPIGVLCIRRTLADGWGVGLACGLGAATADSLYGLVAGLGLTAVTAALVGAQAVLRAAGSVYLAWLGVRALRAAPAAEAASVAGRRALGAFGSTVLLTVTNPATILSFVALFGALVRTPSAPVLAGGVFAGSAAWWLLLSGSVSVLRGRIRPAHLVWVNRVSGAVLCGFAVWAGAGLFA